MARRVRISPVLSRNRANGHMDGAALGTFPHEDAGAMRRRRERIDRDVVMMVVREGLGRKLGTPGVVTPSARWCSVRLTAEVVNTA